MTQGSTIALNVLVMNLEKLVELLLVLFASWLQLPLCNQPGKGSRFVCLSTEPNVQPTSSTAGIHPFSNRRRA